MKIKIILAIAAITIMAGCVQLPTTESTTVDNRPQLTFKANTDSPLDDYRVFIDGLDNGSIAPFSDGTKSLRLLPGTHLVEIYKGDKLISSQKIYLGDGVTKEVIVE